MTLPVPLLQETYSATLITRAMSSQVCAHQLKDSQDFASTLQQKVAIRRPTSSCLALTHCGYDSNSDYVQSYTMTNTELVLLLKLPFSF